MADRSTRDRQAPEDRLGGPELGRALMDAIPGACLVVGAQEEIIHADRAAARLLGRSIDQLTGISLRTILPDGLPTGSQQPSLSGPTTPTRLVEGVGADGETQPLMVHVGPETDLLGGRLVQLEDAAGYEDPKRELHRYAEQLEQANQDLEQFVYGASHDLKEPLRLIEGHLKLLEDRLEPGLDPRAQSALAYALDGAQRMEQLIEGLLTYSRAGFRNEPMGTVHLEEALEDALANLASKIEASGATITRDPMPMIVGDRVQLTSVFQNLVSNAIKFTPDQRTPTIHIGHEPIDEGAHVWVEDNGIGIPEEHQERLFEMFQRLHGPDDYEGSGIGLALCQRIVDRHRGRIWVDATEDSGSTFHPTLKAGTPQPSPEPDEPPTVEKRGHSPNGHGEPCSTILIDDVEGIRALVRIALESSQDYTVVGEASDGREGIEVAKAEQPELVLLDLSMPGMDGLEALPLIQEASPESQIIIFSGFQGERLGQEAKARGAIGYIEKGADPDELLEQIDGLMGQAPSSS